MKLRTRLTVLSALVITILSFGISATALVSAERSEIARLDSVLNGIVDGAATKDDVVSAAMRRADESPINVAVAFVTYEDDVTMLSQSKLKLDPVPTLEQRRDARNRPVTVAGPERYRMRTYKIAPQEFLVVATSMSSIDENRRANLQVFSLLTLGGVAIAIVVSYLLIRRDVKVIDQLIDVADDISQGRTDVSIPTTGGNAEVDQLTDALHRMVTSLQHAVEMEQGTQKRMQMFLGDASHELRTPLTVIKGYVEMLDNGQDLEPEQKERAFLRLNSEIGRMEKLISDLLLLARLGDETEEPFERVDLSDIVTGAAEDLQALDAGRPVTVAIVDGIFVNGSATLLNQLVANSVANIRRHTSADVPVNISLSAEDDGVVLVIEDGGPGLSDEAYERGIQHFQRFDPSRSRASGGSGLGMSIMGAIVRRHNGVITISRSRLGGLRIEVRLPR